MAPERHRCRVKTVRSILNELRWREDRDFAKVEVEYVHRGAPGDITSVKGGDIISLEPWMMVIRRAAGPNDRSYRPGTPVPGQAAIPYHRIIAISYDGSVVFERSAKVKERAGGRGQP